MGRYALTNLLLLYKRNNSLPNIWFSMLNFERIDRQEFSIAGYSYSVAYSTIKFEYTHDHDAFAELLKYVKEMSSNYCLVVVTLGGGDIQYQPFTTEIIFTYKVNVVTLPNVHQ